MKLIVLLIAVLSAGIYFLSMDDNELVFDEKGPAQSDVKIKTELVQEYETQKENKTYLQVGYDECSSGITQTADFMIGRIGTDNQESRGYV